METINNKNKKELVKIFRDKVCKGKYASRSVLLAYAFLKDAPYKLLENKIHEDQYKIESVKSFLVGLSWDVAREIIGAAYNKPFYQKQKELMQPPPDQTFSKIRKFFIRSDEQEKTLGEFSMLTANLAAEIHSWMLKKYESFSEVAA